MSVLQFLATLPSILGITGFAIYYFLLRTRQGDRVTLDIIAKLRQTAPEALPKESNLDPATLAKLIENDRAFRSKVSNQDFQLLRDALRQQFVGSIIVYSICAAVFFAGVVLYIYVTTRPIPVTIASVSAHSTNPKAKGLSVDLDTLGITWTASGPPEDVKVAVEEMETQARTTLKSVRSSEGHVEFSPEELRPVLKIRDHNGRNRLRAVFQSSETSFTSEEFDMYVGTTILAAHIEPLRIKIAGMIDSTALDNYSFEAKLVVWAQALGHDPDVFTYGGKMNSGNSDVLLDPALQYRWDDVKLVYLGPDDARIVRTELLGF